MTDGRRSRDGDIEGVVEFTAPVYRDERGLFTTPFLDSDFASTAMRAPFPVRDVSFSVSSHGVLRGIHYTNYPPGRAKYVYCVHGRVADYLVDLRAGSPTYGRSETRELSGSNGSGLYIPVGVGHAYLALEDESVMVYLMSEEYFPHRECSVSALDPELGLPVPRDAPITQSERDMAAPTVAEARQRGMLPDFRSCLQAETGLRS